MHDDDDLPTVDEVVLGILRDAGRALTFADIMERFYWYNVCYHEREGRGLAAVPRFGVWLLSMLAYEHVRDALEGLVRDRLVYKAWQRRRPGWLARFLLEEKQPVTMHAYQARVVNAFA